MTDVVSCVLSWRECASDELGHPWGVPRFMVGYLRFRVLFTRPISRKLSQTTLGRGDIFQNQIFARLVGYVRVPIQHYTPPMMYVKVLCQIYYLFSHARQLCRLFLHYRGTTRGRGRGTQATDAG